MASTPMLRPIPLIGIPCLTVPRQGDGRPVYGNNPAYISAVVAAGGAPLLIPPLDNPDALEAIYACLDGLLLSGGPDIDPRAFGEDPIPACGDPDRPRDALELTLAHRAVADELPLLGICRGLQVLNVALGGTLYQDIPTQVPEAAAHQRGDLGRDYRAHSVRVESDSHLARALGTTEHQVNSLHHQSIARPGDGMRIVAQAPDGIAEGIELPGHPFALAVQFHPEELAATDEVSRNLFAAFVQACAERMRAREQVAAH